MSEHGVGELLKRVSNRRRGGGRGSRALPDDLDSREGAQAGSLPAQANIDAFDSPLPVRDIGQGAKGVCALPKQTHVHWPWNDGYVVSELTASCAQNEVRVELRGYFCLGMVLLDLQNL